MNRPLLILGCLLVSACASVRDSTRPPTGEAQELASRYDELRRLDDELARREARASDRQAGPLDCGRVGQLRDNICELATRICQLADREPANSVASQRCADGKARCQSAVERAQARGCSKK